MLPHWYKICVAYINKHKLAHTVHRNCRVATVLPSMDSAGGERGGRGREREGESADFKKATIILLIARRNCTSSTVQ